jgi:hypothetical protein
MIPSYDDAPNYFAGSVPMRGDDPRHDAMFSYITRHGRDDKLAEISPQQRPTTRNPQTESSQA